MHRDIKPENILIDPDTLNIKLIDFGFAKLSNTPNNTNYMVTRWYRPLEIVLNLPYNEKVDVFAVGALILELYLGNEVFRSGSNIDQFYWIVNICGFPEKWTKAHEVIAKMNLKVEKSTPRLKDLMTNIRPLAADLLTKMLNASP
jgi:serine/threonine protein kinase